MQRKGEYVTWRRSKTSEVELKKRPAVRNRPSPIQPLLKVDYKKRTNCVSSENKEGNNVKMTTRE